VAAFIPGAGEGDFDWRNKYSRLVPNFSQNAGSNSFVRGEGVVLSASEVFVRHHWSIFLRLVFALRLCRLVLHRAAEDLGYRRVELVKGSSL
jgi:hypothetical protein